MRFFWTGVATLLASLGHLVGFQSGLIWTALVGAGLGLWSLYHRVRPGVQSLDRLHWQQIMFVLVGATVLGLVLRFSLFGSAGLVSMLF